MALEALDRYTDLGVAAWARGEARKDAGKSIQCIRMFSRVHRLTEPAPDQDIPDLLAYYSDLWLSGKFIPLAKWATATPLAHMAGVMDLLTGKRVHNDPPPKPDWLPNGTSPLTALFPTLDVRSVKCAYRTRLGERKTGRPSKRARHLAWSLLGSKAMFPSMWVDQVGKSLQDHATLLGHTEPPPLGDLAEEMIDLVAESISLITTPKTINYSGLPRPRLSSSAGWVKMFDQEARRWTTMCGTRAAQFERLGGFFGSELVHMDYRPWSGVVETRGIPYAFDWHDWDFDPLVSIVALQEPFKIRTISIADGPATAAASPLQKIWHSQLRSLAPFSLIGGERVEKAAREVFPNWDAAPFVSGDYSAATDRLSMHASKRMLKGLLKRVALEPKLRHRIETSLFSAVMDYSRTLQTFKGKVPPEILKSIPLPPKTRQRNGQLMGNILSFPILCLVNLAAYLTAVVGYYRQNPSVWPTYTRSGKNLASLLELRLETGYLTRHELNDLPVLINGDDILFQAHMGLYEHWLSNLSEFGLVPSVGKNYYSDEFFTVNSELYTREGFQSRPWWGGFQTDLVRARQEIRFETGMDVLQADMRKVLPPMQAWLKETVPVSAWPEVNRMWIDHLHDSGLLDPYKGLNWFLPAELGGMGLDSAGFADSRVTYAQRKLAVRLYLDPDGFRFPGVEGSLVSATADQNYRLLLGSVPRRGLVVEFEGVKCVVDHSVSMDPDAVVDSLDDLSEEEETVRLWPIVNSLVSRAKHIDRWLDHHVTGIRLEADAVRDGVRRALHWGLKMSDKHLDAWEGLDVQPRYNCARESWVVPRELIVSL